MSPDQLALHDLAGSLAQGDDVLYGVGTRWIGTWFLLDPLYQIFQHFDGSTLSRERGDRYPANVARLHSLYLEGMHFKPITKFDDRGRGKQGQERSRTG